MLKYAVPSLVGLALAGAAFAVSLQPPEMPPMPKPSKEHEFLKQFVGEWESTGECTMSPGQTVQVKGGDKVRMLGGFWMVSNGTMEMIGMKMENVFTLGYDPEKKKYVGQWVDSMMPHAWKYEGEVDESGRKITLHTSGPSPKSPGKTCKFRETFEFKSADERLFTSSYQEDDGKWTQMVTFTSKRKK